MLGELRRASKRGAAIASFNPLRERGLERFADPQDKLEMLRGGSTRISSDYFQLRIGGDLAAVKGIIKHVLEADEQARRDGSPRVVDVDFITRHTTGFAAFAAAVADEAWETIETESGLAQEQLRPAGDIYKDAGRGLYGWGRAK